MGAASLSSLRPAWGWGATVKGLRGSQAAKKCGGGSDVQDVALGGGGEGGPTTDSVDLPVERRAGVVRAGLQHGSHTFPGSLLQWEAPGLGG